MIIRDKNTILEALKSGRKVYSIAVAPGMRSDKRVDEIIRLAGKMGARVAELPPVKERGGGKGGWFSSIEARAEDYQYADLDDIREKAEGRAGGALIVALDHVQDPRNLGAILRTAAGAGADAVVIEKKRCCEVTDAVYETSCGGADRTPVVKVANLRQALERMKRWGCWIAGADERAEKDCFSTDLASVSVLVLGGEGEGISRLVCEECDFLVRIPTAPEFPSLNVSVAAGILIFETLRQKKARSSK
jgi:23S rRNA (guanosine2251-2'-O)-methyltransferase